MKQTVHRVLCFAFFAILYGILLICYLQGNAFEKSGYFIGFTLFWIILLLAFLFLKNVRIPKKYSIPYRIFLTIVVSVVCFLLPEIIYNEEFKALKIGAVFVNIAIVFFLNVFLQLLIPLPKMPHYVLLLVFYVYGVISHYVYVFKGNPFRPYELVAYMTGLSVAGRYVYVISDGMVWGTVLLAVLFLLIETIEIKPSDIMPISMKKALAYTGIRCCLAVALIAILINIDWKNLCKVQLNAWDVNIPYKTYGSVLTFLTEIQEINIKKPKGYSKKEVLARLSQYESKTEAVQSGQQFPNIVCIMNESFADLSVMGEIDTFEEMEAWNSIEDWLMKGYTYVSVYAAGTADSEFEFLTHISKANLPLVSCPYQFYDLSRVPNLSEELLAYGYKTVAFHPYNKGNYNRDNVYRGFSFENFFDLSHVENNIRIDNSFFLSDEYDYEVVKEICKQSDDPVFIFNVTTQNHGGFFLDMLNKDRLVSNADYPQYNDVTVYRTMIKESSQAFAGLLNDFREMDEPVVVCLFGDHLPGLDSNFVNELLATSAAEVGEDALNNVEARQKTYKTPYMIWANYDMGRKQVQADTSLNYLGAKLLEAVGITTPYIQYLLELEKDIPIINALGYLRSDGTWHEISEPDERVLEYKNIAYYMMTK